MLSVSIPIDKADSIVVKHLDLRVNKIIVLFDTFGFPVDRKHVIEIMLIELVATTLALEELTHVAVILVLLREAEIENSPLTHEVAGVCVVLYVADDLITVLVFPGLIWVDVSHFWNVCAFGVVEVICGVAERVYLQLLNAVLGEVCEQPI